MTTRDYGLRVSYFPKGLAMYHPQLEWHSSKSETGAS